MQKGYRRKKVNLQFNKRALFKLSMVFVFLLCILFLLIFIFIRMPLYFSTAKIDRDGRIVVSVYNFYDLRIVKAVVPPETELKLAMQRGSLRAKGLPRLVETEKLPAQFVVDSLMKSFHLPIDYWEKDMPTLAKLAVLLNSLRGVREENVNLEDSQVLKKKVLADGEDGYIISGSMPISLLGLFSDPKMSSGQMAVRIVNQTGKDNNWLNDIFTILEVLGVKSVPPRLDEKSDIDCIVRTSNKYILSRLTSIFNCELDSSPPEVFDIELIIGEKFFKRF